MPAPGGRGNGFPEDHRAALFLEAQEKVEVLANGQGREAAQGAEHLRPHKDALVAVHQIEVTRTQRRQPRDGLQGRGVGIDRQAERAALVTAVLHDMSHAFETGSVEIAVGVQEQQEVAPCFPGGGVHLHRPPPFRGDAAHAVVPGDGRCVVLAAAVADEDLKRRDPFQALQRSRQQPRLIQCGDDHRYVQCWFRFDAVLAASKSQKIRLYNVLALLPEAWQDRGAFRLRRGVPGNFHSGVVNRAFTLHFPAKML
ncbi:protein of unknown function [Nitrospina watsonii]|uniref:Uncharacterized protein n=1 Tax=Nitrospina watsonii TaxID=1323948 RepID=A0ABN8W1N6_9BACT|nr:protein of unknown function [Nitrospina watsonii]